MIRSAFILLAKAGSLRRRFWKHLGGEAYEQTSVARVVQRNAHIYVVHEHHSIA
jgi:hypothetical protein